jgi:signal transduction histidine kinase
MKLTESLSGDISDKFISDRLVLPLAAIFTMTILGVLSVELFSDTFLPVYEISGMHIITVLFSGIIATAAASLVLRKIRSLYMEIYLENEERKRAEEALTVAKDEAELYVDLMCHDINNLNQVALGYLEMARDVMKDEETKAFILKPLGVIRSSSELIENVGKLQKVKGDRLKVEAVDINDVLFELQSEFARGKEVTIRFDPSPGCYVLANGLIKDVFSNLIGNAVKHSGSGPVQISLMLKRLKARGQEYIEVAVEDNGPGIPDDIKDKIFSRFQRGDTKAHGKGLGLYLVKTLVEGFHGRVRAEDRVPGDRGRGSRFVVRLPAAGANNYSQN